MFFHRGIFPFPSTQYATGKGAYDCNMCKDQSKCNNVPPFTECCHDFPTGKGPIGDKPIGSRSGSHGEWSDEFLVFVKADTLMLLTTYTVFFTDPPRTEVVGRLRSIPGGLSCQRVVVGKGIKNFFTGKISSCPPLGKTQRMRRKSAKHSWARPS